MELNFYQRQAEFVSSSAGQVLAAGDGGGKSYALRVGALLYCLHYPGAIIGLLHARHDELVHEHVEGRAGLKSMLARQPGTATFGSSGIKFSNGSRLVWAGADRAPDVERLMQAMPQVVYVDELHRIPRDAYDQLVRRTSIRGGRVVSAAPPLGRAGWVAEWFRETSPDRQVIRTGHDDLPEKFRREAEEPSITDFLDSLGVPFLAADSSYRAKRYVQVILSVLQRWYWAEFARLVILMPTQYGKTLLGVRTMGGYIPLVRPQETVGIATYDQSKSIKRNRDARDFYVMAGGALKTRDQRYWQTPYGGGAWAEGVGGGAGNPMDWGLFDDPDRGPKESKSLKAIEYTDDFYRYTWVGRGAINTAKRELSLLTVGTRMWYGDTVKRVFEYHMEKKESVHVLVLPALYDPAVADYYEALGDGLITVEPDWREPGEPLDASRRSAEDWKAVKQADPNIFASRDQQMPMDEKGGTWLSVEWPIDLAEDPGKGAEREVYLRSVRAYDIAHTEGGGHWTASVKMGILQETGRVVVRHASRGRFGPRNVLRMVGAQMLLDGWDLPVVLPEDPAAGAQTIDRVKQYMKDLARVLTIKCPGCAGPACAFCGGDGWLVVNRSPLRTASVKRQDQDFEDFASRAAPVSTTVEGMVDYVRLEWQPTIQEIIPWFWQAAEQADATWRAELQELDTMARKLLRDNARWWVDYWRELHLYPSIETDDWVSATSYAWQLLDRRPSLYPG